MNWRPLYSDSVTFHAPVTVCQINWNSWPGGRSATVMVKGSPAFPCSGSTRMVPTYPPCGWPTVTCGPKRAAGSCAKAGAARIETRRTANAGTRSDWRIVTGPFPDAYCAAAMTGEPSITQSCDAGRVKGSQVTTVPSAIVATTL